MSTFLDMRKLLGDPTFGTTHSYLSLQSECASPQSHIPHLLLRVYVSFIKRSCLYITSGCSHANAPHQPRRYGCCFWRREASEAQAQKQGIFSVVGLTSAMICFFSCFAVQIQTGIRTPQYARYQVPFPLTRYLLCVDEQETQYQLCTGCMLPSKQQRT